MRAHRLIAILLMLQTRRMATAREIAAELEISVATVRRDLEALSAAGVPVYSVRGRGGGWRLVGGARTDLTGLTASEAHALFAALGSTDLTSDQQVLLRKLQQAIPESFRPEAASAMQAVRHDVSRWGDREHRQPEDVDILQQAIIRSRQVNFTYTNRAGATRRRTVSPLRLVDKSGTWYLLGCEDAQNAVKTFRVDRASTLEVLDEHARPAPEDLDEVWRATVEQSEHERARISATVAMDEDDWPVLRDRFGRHAGHLEDRPDGAIHIRVAAHTPRGLAEQLAGWGRRIEVLEPESVRDELARIGEELTELYG